MGASVLSLSTPASVLAAPNPQGLDHLTQALPGTQSLLSGVRALDLYRPATKERLSIPYLINGQWADQAYNRLCWALRDVRAGQHVQMDIELIAMLDWIQAYLAQYGYKEPLHILSGYRSPITNSRTEGAAKNSLHIRGKAVDIRIPGLSTKYLGELAAWLSRGGVGVYADKQFVHLDTGNVRRWGDIKRA